MSIRKQNKKKATRGIGTALLAGTIKEWVDSRQPKNKFDKKLQLQLLEDLVTLTINLFNKK